MAAVPARLKSVHPLLLAHARTQTKGDWSRVVLDESGAVLILNKALSAPPKKAAPARKAPAKSAASTPIRELNRDPVIPESRSKVYEQKLVHSTLPKHLRPEPVLPRRTRPAPEPVKFTAPQPVSTPTVRDRLTDAERVAAAQMRRPVQITDKPVPAEFDIRVAWENLDVNRVASSMLAACRKGLPAALPLDLHADVLALEGINRDLVIASVRNPHYVEIAALETNEKGYVVLRFFRGDIKTVVGFREAQLPVIIATYAISLLQHDHHAPGSMKGGTGGGGARKQGGLPKTPAAVAKKLRAMGAEVAVNELSDEPAVVMYQGQELGKISTKASKDQCESDYQRCIRKMEAIARRANSRAS